MVIVDSLTKRSRRYALPGASLFLFWPIFFERLRQNLRFNQPATGTLQSFSLAKQNETAPCLLMKKRIFAGTLIGLTAGCLVGGLSEFRSGNVDGREPYVLSVNQQTGRPQLHVQGKPEINK
jgi:hypothetical protein